MKTQTFFSDRSPAERPLSILRISIADMISLNVRTRGRRDSDLPATLYQAMPEKAMALMATIPYGTEAVSIPGAIGRGSGCPILKNAPAADDGIVIVYMRKPNGRYEAAAVQYRGDTVDIAEFVSFACQWVRGNMGELKAKPGRHGYFAPDREEWGVILRDSGYVAWDPGEMPLDMSPELSACRQAKESSGILARIPKYAGDARLWGDIVPVFARVEVALHSDPKQDRDWIGFEEYCKIRADRARLPNSIIPDFQEWLRLFTEESGFASWVFRPGMLFGDSIEWWGDGCRRRTEHEGLDFAAGRLPDGKVLSIPEGIPVRSLATGEVVAILDDFIGKTVIVRHPAISRPEGEVFHTLLSHIRPQVGLADAVSKGQVVGVVGKLTKASAPSHLHLTGAWIPAALCAGEIRMEHIHPAFEPVSLVNFTDQLQNNPLCSLELQNLAR